MNDYRINVEAFEGPLDLLLYLIRKNDLSITDIPIAFILEEYVKYLDSLKEMNIDVAGEFLLMVAELAYIKSKMLLPEDGRQEEEEEGDPREDLVKRLLEYQRYKEAAAKLAERSQLFRDVYVPLSTKRTDAADIAPAGGMIEADVYELVDAFAHILVRLPKEQFHNVTVDRISVNERIMELVELIKKDETVRIEDLLVKPITRYGVVVTFLSLLEMARLKMIKVFQSERCGSIILKGIMEEARPEDMLRLVKTDVDVKPATKAQAGEEA
jgi:segregation and condensation protein A